MICRPTQIPILFFSEPHRRNPLIDGAPHGAPTTKYSCMHACIYPHLLATCSKQCQSRTPMRPVSPGFKFHFHTKISLHALLSPHLPRCHISWLCLRVYPALAHRVRSAGPSMQGQPSSSSLPELQSRGIGEGPTLSGDIPAF